MTADPLTRFLLNRWVVKCRRRVRRLIAIARSEFILSNPRLPRRTKKGSQQRTRPLSGVEEGAEDTGDSAEKGALLTDFYANLFRATEKQAILPKWADLKRRFRREDLEELPRIDGPLLRRATNLFKNNKSCAGDRVVSEPRTSWRHWRKIS